MNPWGKGMPGGMPGRKLAMPVSWFHTQQPSSVSLSQESQNNNSGFVHGCL